MLFILAGFMYLVCSIVKTNNMKKIITLAFAVTIGLSASAQKIKVKQSSENIGGASHNALTVTLYGISPSDAEDAFRSFMKTYDGKRGSKDGGIFIDHAT